MLNTVRSYKDEQVWSLSRGMCVFKSMYMNHLFMNYDLEIVEIVK